MIGKFVSNRKMLCSAGMMVLAFFLIYPFLVDAEASYLVYFRK